jgi:hypothetical protein
MLTMCDGVVFGGIIFIPNLVNIDRLVEKLKWVHRDTTTRWLPSEAVRVRCQVGSCGIMWAGFLRVLRFPLPILIAPTAPNSSYMIHGWHNRPNSGQRTKWTQFRYIRCSFPTIPR